MENTYDQEPGENYYLTTREAAAFLKISPRTLERLRITGGGPRFTKVGTSIRSRVVYKRSDLIEWMEGRSFGSTSEYD